ncbi:hypothetical protein ACFVFF_23240 [Streptomyces sp. NPDC057680]|uniref:hypothetical protein n=1 Tax=Streptomyces sp. NPDC057680 TaxID=3346208 RepID=UPI00367D7287
MSLKPSYQATRGDEKKFLREISPGDHLYVVNEHYDRGNTYSEWIVTNTRSLTGNKEVESPTNGATTTAQSLLRKHREVLTQRPSHLPNLGVRETHDAYTEEGQRAAQRIGDVRATQAANSLSERYRSLARR